MNLKLFFKAPKTVEALKPSAIGASIKSLTDESLDIAQTDIAIIGLTEDRGTEANLGVSEGADIIRDKFYRLKKSAVNYRIADLGNLQNGESLTDTVARLREVCV